MCVYDTTWKPIETYIVQMVQQSPRTGDTSPGSGAPHQRAAADDDQQLGQEALKSPDISTLDHVKVNRTGGPVDSIG